MTQAKTGDTARIHYTGTLTDGTQFDSSEGRDPLEFEIGSGQIIQGLDSAISGMEVGEKKTVNVPCLEAYGPIQPGMRQPVPRKSIPEDIPLEVGMQLQMQSSEGQVLSVTVVEIGDEDVMLDGNHPLAGQDLVFEIELVSLSD